MKRHIKTLVLTAASIAVTTTAAMPAQACGGRSGRSYVSVSRYPVVRQPVYVRPVQSACGTPRVVQPPVHMPQPVQQPIQPVQRPLQPVQQPIQPVGGINRQPVRSVATVNQVNPAAATTPAATTAAPQVSTPVQAVTPAGNASATNTPTAEASALQMLAAMSASQAAPAQAAAAAQPAQQAAPQIPQFTAANQQPAANHVGTWKANLGNNQAVELTLKANGSFVWTAVRSGKSSTFEGQFRLESGRLTLVRSNDLQQMAGSWSGAGNQFTFKLGGATTGSLAFQRT